MGRLCTSKVAAEERLTALINQGYRVHGDLERDYSEKVGRSTFDREVDNARYRESVNVWARDVLEALTGIFPTELEANIFSTPQPWLAGEYLGKDQNYGRLMDRVLELIHSLENILLTHLPRYTELPIQERLYVEDIDSFRKVRDVNPDAVRSLLSPRGYFYHTEEALQLSLERILEVSLHKKDWGGEINDLYTANIVVNGRRAATAFLLKGRGLRKDLLEIADCGRNGEQLLRLFDSPAELFVVQFVGTVSLRAPEE
jgi:hypothetical protein